MWSPYFSLHLLDSLLLRTHVHKHLKQFINYMVPFSSVNVSYFSFSEFLESSPQPRCPESSWCMASYDSFLFIVLSTWWVLLIWKIMFFQFWDFEEEEKVTISYVISSSLSYILSFCKFLFKYQVVNWVFLKMYLSHYSLV